MKLSSPRSLRLFVLLALLPVVAVTGCLTFPAPDPPTKLTKAQATAVVKCQRVIKNAGRVFQKVQFAALDACVGGILAARLPFENGLIEQGAFDAGITKMRGKCTKSYSKITAASTKFVDAVVKSCTPVQEAVLGPYDALRFQGALFGGGGTIESLAGFLCGFSAYTASSQLWEAGPRVNELLGYLGPDFVLTATNDTQEFGVPNVKLDPRCPPLVAGSGGVAGIPGFCQLLPTPTPISTP